MTSTADQVAGDPERYNLPIYLGPSSRVAYDCLGYSRGGKVKFGRLLGKRGKVSISLRYLDPDQTVYHDEVKQS